MAELWWYTRRTRWTKRRQSILEAAGVTAHPEVLGQLRKGACCGRRGFARTPQATQDQPCRGEDGKVRRSPQAVACRKRGVEARGRPQQLLHGGSDGGWSTALEARQGKPGDGPMRAPTRRDASRAREAEK